MAGGHLKVGEILRHLITAQEFLFHHVLPQLGQLLLGLWFPVSRICN